MEETTDEYTFVHLAVYKKSRDIIDKYVDRTSKDARNLVETTLKLLQIADLLHDTNLKLFEKLNIERK